MNTFFAPHDFLYPFLTLVVVAVHTFYMPRRPTLQQQQLLHLPGAFLHELSHAFVALVLGGNPKMHVTPRPDGNELILGETSWGPLLFGNFGRVLVGGAPVLWWIPVAYIAGSQLGEPQGLLAGLWWLAACLVCMDAALMVSLSDLENMGLAMTLTHVLVWSALFIHVFGVQVPMALCSHVGILCGTLGA